MRRAIFHKLHLEVELGLHICKSTCRILGWSTSTPFLSKTELAEMTQDQVSGQRSSMLRTLDSHSAAHRARYDWRILINLDACRGKVLEALDARAVLTDEVWHNYERNDHLDELLLNTFFQELFVDSAHKLLLCMDTVRHCASDCNAAFRRTKRHLRWLGY